MQYQEIKELIELFEKTDLNDLELTIDNVSLRLNRSAAAVPSYAMPAMGVVPPVKAMPQAELPKKSEEAAVSQETKQEASAAVSEPQGEGVFVKAPIVGTFYASSAPDKPPYVKVGDTVAEGDTLCIIEAMKFMNEVPSEAGGKIVEILVKDGDFVEFGQPLFRII